MHILHIAEPGSPVPPTPPEPELPICLDDLFRRGATYQGRPVESLEIRFAGGRLEVELSREEESEPELSPMEAAILEVVGSMKVGEVMTTDEIAKRAGYQNSGKMRGYLKLIAPAAKLRSTYRGWAKT